MRHITLILTLNYPQFFKPITKHCPANIYNPDGLALTGRQAICGCKLKIIHKMTANIQSMLSSWFKVFNLTKLMKIYTKFSTNLSQRVILLTSNSYVHEYYIMDPPTMLLVPICGDMQLWWDKPSIPSLRNCMPSETCFDDVGRIYACVTWTQMYVTLQTKKVFHSKAVIMIFY